MAFAENRQKLAENLKNHLRPVGIAANSEWNGRKHRGRRSGESQGSLPSLGTPLTQALSRSVIPVGAIAAGIRVALAPPPMALGGAPVVMPIRMVRMPIAVGIVPSLRGRNIGHTDDCDGAKRECQGPQEMRRGARIARRSRRHAKPPFKMLYLERTTARPHAQIRRDREVLAEKP